MEFRIADESARKEIERLWAYCFEPAEHPFFQWYFTNYFRPENVLAGFDDSQMSCCLHLNPYEIYVRGSVLPTSYIVGLATKPEARRGGVAGQMLAAALVEMRRRGHWLNLLMPSRAGFYYPYEWQLCYHHVKYRVNLDELRPVAHGAGIFRPVDAGDFTALDSVYRHFVSARHGYVVRREENWRHLLDSHYAENGYAYLLEQNGDPVGYLLYAFREGRMVIGDMAYTSMEGCRSLLNFMYNHRATVPVAEWDGPLDDILPLLLPNPKEGVSHWPFMAARVVDVAQALAALTYPKEAEGCLKLAVSDRLADWNNGVFAINVRAGKAEVQPLGAVGEADIVCNVGALGQLIFGRLSAVELAYLGTVTGQEDKVLLLDQLFPKCNNYINEYF